MSGDFDGKVAIVTGAARGIGKAAAAMLSARGCRVAFIDIDAEPAAAAAAEGRGRGASFGCDLSDSGATILTIQRIMDHFGRIDILANVAGIFPFARALETSDELLHRVMAVNFFAVAYACKAVAPLMKATGGAIINVASGAGVRPIAGLSAYGASKGAVIAFSRSLALELAPDIRVNVVSPGPTQTEGAATMRGDGGVGSAVDRGSPMGRSAQAAEVAEAICYLASDRAGFITGQNLHVSGGRFMP